jgi:hypothetical protein
MVIATAQLSRGRGLGNGVFDDWAASSEALKTSQLSLGVADRCATT